MDHTTISLIELVSNAKMQLDLLGYAEGTKRRYALMWDHFLLFAERNDHTHFSKELGRLFLENYCGIASGKKLSLSQVFKVRTIIVLGEMLELNCFRKCHHRVGQQPPPQFLDVLSEYEKRQQEKKLSKRTICWKKISLVRFLNYLDSFRCLEKVRK